VRAQVRPWLFLGATGGLLTLVLWWTAQRRKRKSEDLGLGLVELFAYIGDRLSDYQDAVANEGFLAPARKRRAVGRIKRLSNYRGGRGRCPTRRPHGRRR
jgi:hypothetical protein